MPLNPPRCSKTHTFRRKRVFCELSFNSHNEALILKKGPTKQNRKRRNSWKHRQAARGRTDDGSRHSALPLVPRRWRRPEMKEEGPLDGWKLFLSVLELICPEVFSHTASLCHCHWNRHQVFAVCNHYDGLLISETVGEKTLLWKK